MPGRDRPMLAERPRPAAQQPTVALAPAPVAPVPAGTVESQPLPGPDGTLPIDPNAPIPDNGIQVAATPAAAPAAQAVQVGRLDVAGGWRISSGGDTCSLSMALTSWTGGYRASTRGCSGPALKDVSAWNLEGGRVTLINSSGATVARLSPASKREFSGQTDAGAPVSMTR